MKNQNGDVRKGFSERLNEALTALDWPQRGRAAKIQKLLPNNISLVSIRKWLVGEGYPATERIALLAQMANVSANWLLTGATTSERDLTLDQQELGRAIDRVIQLSACDFLDPQTKSDLRMVGTELLKII